MSEVSQILKADHRKVKQLFDDFAATEDKRAKQRIAEEAMQDLEVHSLVEEEIVYPALRATPKEGEDLFQEASEEHHVIKTLIDELRELTSKDENFEAKFNVLAENVRHHIQEEEKEMLPCLEDSDFDAEAMAEEMQARKEELTSTVEAGTGRRHTSTRAKKPRSRSSK